MSFEIVYHLRRALEKLPQLHYGRKLSYIPSAYDPRDYRYAKMIVAAQPGATLPIDYRDQLPPVFDQEDRGTCVACAAAWTVKAYEEIKQADYPSEGLSASFLYSMCKENDGLPCLEGTQPKVAMQVLRKYGICPEAIMPYAQLSELPCPKVPGIPQRLWKQPAPIKYRLMRSFVPLLIQTVTILLEVIRQALQIEGPFMLALLVCENFQPDDDYELPLPAGLLRGGHAVGIVGDLPERECLILRNSWGSSWGEDGYAYLPYSWLNHKICGSWSVSEAWTATDMTLLPQARRIVVTPGLKTIKVDGKRAAMNNTAFFSKSAPHQTHCRNWFAIWAIDLIGKANSGVYPDAVIADRCADGLTCDHWSIRR